MHLIRLPTLFALLSASWFSVAQDGALEEIVVTARMVEESLQEVPVAVTSIGQMQWMHFASMRLRTS